jgi:hypothetical protein
MILILGAPRYKVLATGSSEVARMILKCPSGQERRARAVRRQITALRISRSHGVSVFEIPKKEW